MKNLSRKLLILFILIVLLGGGYLVYQLQASIRVPSEFSDARAKSALISQDIVNSSNVLSQNLTRINQLDQDKRFKEAHELTTQLIEQSEKIRNDATELSRETERMIRAIENINNPVAQQIAIEMVNYRVALINRLINYSLYFRELLMTLQLRFEGVGTNAQVSDLVNKLNQEVQAINDFNSKATDAMSRFDQIAR